MTPGTQPQRVNKKTMTMEPQPLSKTAMGGNKTETITRQILIYRPDGTVVWAQFDRAYDATIAHTISAAAWKFFAFADLYFRPITELLVV